MASNRFPGVSTLGFFYASKIYLTVQYFLLHLHNKTNLP